ncbi:ABC transporter ATP-binding protein [Gulosibacter molinativorax]|uniref:Sn-glycerol-3-phosphate ABC transporter ATP-binding protein UgpC n=1 Tax=Gulosibacter molinativorax TaxID=256821 RepID=A0ABT7CDT8_9MICO|nr:sn-glycerol-3-phosphate ABC transporter ATP-binding protein UgpC [Gulosibacter molinativorax]MDJ1372732.1 sn-glycerol-3-phosphate ABC transporter ATP-binding protein UgpC [Gulosibacter molinativorax]QUY62843.1 Sugar ABC transporter ATP-binding protein [Gulosibacter molinativorax]
MTTVTLNDVTLTYPGADRPSVDSIGLEINHGEFLVLVGPSGCGKSTTLRILAGLEFPTSGSVIFGDRDVTGFDGSQRDVAMVFQSYALYPHMTVAGNIEFALKNTKVPEAERKQLIQEAAELLELDELLDRKPRELSGGQRQRVAMGRAIVRRPEVFLMDEPLSNLDAKLRVQTRGQIADLQRKLDVTTIYVTHDQTEAMTMGDRVVVMNKGRIEQVGTPRELYDQPETLFVAGFIGSPQMNLVEGTWSETEGARVGDVTLPFRVTDGQNASKLTFGIRPEDLRYIALPGETPDHEIGFATRIRITTELVEELGSDTYVYGTGHGSSWTARLPKGAHPEIGEELTFEVNETGIIAFDPETGHRVR